MKIVAVVPMKLNNTRLPNKNIRKFKNGKQLCWYVLETLRKCKYVDEVYTYCSDRQICSYIPQGVKFLRRSIELDKDTTKINEVLFEFSKEVFADIYVMSHATSPFITSKSIEKGIEAVISSGYDSAFAVKKIQDFMWKNNKPLNYCLDNIPRTQDLEPIYIETSGFYIYRNETISKTRRRIGDRPYLVEVNEIESCDIDEREDFIIADAIQFYRQSED